MLSHEIRTPLTSIRESMSLLEQGVFGEVNEKQRQFLSLSMGEAVRLTDLLERLMTVSRLESGQLDVSPEAADAGQLVREVADSLLPAAEHAGITLDVEINEPARPVRADAERIRQVLLNLGGNAVKFSPKGARVVLAVQPSNGGAEFSVSDDGPGIAEAEQQLVFDKYYRAGSVREEKDAPGWGSPSVAGSWRPTGPRCGWRARSAQGPASPSCCRPRSMKRTEAWKKPIAYWPWMTTTTS
ncbi:sensor histidine kinase [Salidesulfovibrio brasiliensis]|uniref:sensor histidine kinase n=1 Tax=Salidesulfovibrio brasiliensis TaxID=221711 RepID=UPI000B040D39|nr:HAMP domain-containing sensor histidine kinase [Salidesulfovibrio brasiliensis]